LHGNGRTAADGKVANMERTGLPHENHPPYL